MALSMLEQLEIIRDQLPVAAGQGDFDLLVRAIKNPSLLSPAESGTISDSLGLSDGFKRFVTNVATDPTVWLGLLVSARFPTWLYNRGVPKRFVGTAMEYTGLSKFFRPVAKFFRGEGVEEMMALGLHRQGRVFKTMQPVGDVLASLTAEEKRAIVRYREEGLTAGLTPRAKEASDFLTQKMEEAWTTYASKVVDVRADTAQIGPKSPVTWGGFRDKAGSGELLERIPAPRNFRDYVPHLPIMNTEGTLEFSGVEALTRMARAGGKQLEQALAADGMKIGRKRIVDPATGQARDVVVQLGPWTVSEGDRLVSHFADFQRAMQGQTGKHLFRHLKDRVRPDTVFGGKDLFVQDLDQIYSEYTRSLAKSYAWNAPLENADRLVGSFAKENPNPTQAIKRFGGGVLYKDAFVKEALSDEPLMVQVLKAGMRTMKSDATASIVKGTEHWNRPVRLLRFNRNPDSVLKLQALDHLVSGIKGTLDEKQLFNTYAFAGIIEKMLAVAPDNGPLARKMATAIETMRNKQTARATDNFIATFFYGNTLGLNPSSTIANAFQTPLTTLPAVGMGPWLGGVYDFATRLPAYASGISRRFRNAPVVKELPRYARESFDDVFHELVEHGVNTDFRALELDERALAGLGGSLEKKFKTYEDYTKWMLGPFRAAETANRAVTFYASRRAGANRFKFDPSFVPRELIEHDRQHGTSMVKEFFDLHSAMTVNNTQFIAGGGTRTIVQDQVAPWLRQFSTFFTRFLSHAAESTKNGALIEREMQMNGAFDKPLGPLNRSGQNYGTLARTYLYGNILTRGFDDMLGLDVRRWVGFGPIEPDQGLGPLPIPPAVGVVVNTASAIAEREWDRTQPLELPGVGQMVIPKTLVPGGVAVSRLSRAMNHFEPDMGGFVDDENRLVRRAGGVDLMMSMLGVPTDKARRERIQLTQLSVRRQKIHDFRRGYAEAIMSGDFDRAGQLSEQYGSTFRDMPPLDVDPEDLRTYQHNAMMPRLFRALKSIGDQRPFLEGQILDIDPEMIAPPSVAGLLD